MNSPDRNPETRESDVIVRLRWRERVLVLLFGLVLGIGVSWGVSRLALLPSRQIDIAAQNAAIDVADRSSRGELLDAQVRLDSSVVEYTTAIDAAYLGHLQTAFGGMDHEMRGSKQRLSDLEVYLSFRTSHGPLVRVVGICSGDNVVVPILTHQSRRMGFGSARWVGSFLRTLVCAKAIESGSLSASQTDFCLALLREALEWVEFEQDVPREIREHFAYCRRVSTR